MIQFNLLPDVKMEYIRAQRTKRMVMVICGAVAAVSVAVFVVLFLGVMVVQRTHMNNLSADIKKYGNDLQATPNLNKILTVQNQLNSLPAIHQAKPDVTRVLPYIKQLTPSAASIATLNIDYTASTMTITGAADSLGTVNKFVDTLKFTTYQAGDEKDKAFSNVVLSSFGRADKGASYTITMSFVPVIFDNTKKVTLTVPKIVTTRSELEKPSALFEPVTNNGVQE